MSCRFSNELICNRAKFYFSHIKQFRRNFGTRFCPPRTFTPSDLGQKTYSSNFINNLLTNSKSSSNINARCLHVSSVNYHGEYEWEDPKSEEEVVTITVFDKDGTPFKVRGKVGDNLLYLSKRFEVPMEGACEASLACTTCHVYVDEKFQDLLPPSTEKEEDLLDIAPFLKENSRLGCQIILNKELEGLKITLPAATRNFYVDGHKPTSH